MTTWHNTPFEMQFRLIDGLTVRFAVNPHGERDAVLLSPWPETMLAFEPTWQQLTEHGSLVAIELPGFGDRMAGSLRYLRSYPADLPVLRDLLPLIATPVEIVAGAHDGMVPLAQDEFLHQRLQNSRLDVVDAGHFTWGPPQPSTRRLSPPGGAAAVKPSGPKE